jgi:hypothetical protein
MSYILFVDAYYNYDFANPDNHLRPAFLYNHNRHNEFNINLALAGVQYDDGTVRGKLGLMAGTYSEYNLAAELSLLRNVFEANAGFKLSRTHDLWLDAGILPSHIGFENAISIENPTLTRGLAAENSPYYETGVRLSFTSKNEQWKFAALVLNGWQRIRKTERNSSLSFGTQATYTCTENLTLNWSTFVGNDMPDTAKQIRYFNNFYSIFSLSKSLKLTVGFDIGLQENVTRDAHDTWIAPTLILTFEPNKNLAISARGEYYSDPKKVIVGIGTNKGFSTFGSSINLDRKINKRIWWRTEVRSFVSDEPIFDHRKTLRRTNYAAITSLAFKL